MGKSLFKQMGGTYTQVGDYLLPNLFLPEQIYQLIEVWGQQYARYLKQHHKILYYNLLTSGKLNGYLADIDKQAEKMFSRIVKQIAERDGVTEHFKEEDYKWVQQINNIHNRTTKIVNNEVICTT